MPPLLKGRNELQPLPAWGGPETLGWLIKEGVPLVCAGCVFAEAGLCKGQRGGGGRCCWSLLESPASSFSLS